MSLDTFLSVLLVYRHNFQVLHWMAHGESFLTIHEQAKNYYDSLSDDIDVVAEMILRNKDSIINYKEALDLVDEADHDFLLMTGKDLCDMSAFVEFSTKMFNDLKTCVEEVLDEDYIESDHSVGIKSVLEGMHDKYDLQARYIVKRLTPIK